MDTSQMALKLVSMPLLLASVVAAQPRATAVVSPAPRYSPSEGEVGHESKEPVDVSGTKRWQDSLQSIWKCLNSIGSTPGWDTVPCHVCWQGSGQVFSEWGIPDPQAEKLSKPQAPHPHLSAV